MYGELLKICFGQLSIVSKASEWKEPERSDPQDV